MNIEIGEPFLTVLITIAGVVTYEISYRTLSNLKFISARFHVGNETVLKELLRRISGCIFLGAIPFFLTSFILELPVTFLDFPQEWSTISLLWLSGLLAFVTFVPVLAIKQKGHLKKYPQMRIQKWTLNRVLLNSASWSAQLFSYELLFRGVLLFTTASAWGNWPAILINALLYSLAHIPKGWKEALGSFPFAVLLCFTTLAFGSIWPVVFAHITLALANDMLAIQKNSDMYFEFRFTINRSKT